jgi:molecular chaperone DnaK
VNGIFEVKATTGNTQLGGDDFDALLVEWIMKEFKRDTGIDLRDDPVAPQRVREAAERAKCELSAVLETSINLPFIASSDQGPVHLEMLITRGLFEGLIKDLIESTRPLCEQVLKDAGLTHEDLDTVVLVGGSTRIPMLRTLVEEAFHQEPVHSVNPDEVVAMGAAIAGSVVSGQRKDLVLLDVTSLTLGVETLGGVMAPIIVKNSPLPIKRSKMFTTAVDNQQIVGIHVLQGERELTEDNRSLARFELVGIRPAPRGVPRIEVAFSIDANGILFVNAKDAVTGKHQELKVNPSGGLSDDDVRELIRDARQYREADRDRTKLIEERNVADQLIYEASKLLNTSKDRLDGDSLTELKSALDELRTARDNSDLASIERAKKDLDMVLSTSRNILNMLDTLDSKDDSVDIESLDQKEGMD